MIETYEEFVSRLMNRISEESSEEISFSRRSILKNNNKRLDAITVCRAGYDLCPTIYPEFYYQQYQKGEDFETLLMRIMEGIRHEITAERIDLKNVSDFHKMKDQRIQESGTFVGPCPCAVSGSCHCLCLCGQCQGGGDRQFSDS